MMGFVRLVRLILASLWTCGVRGDGFGHVNVYFDDLGYFERAVVDVERPLVPRVQYDKLQACASARFALLRAPREIAFGFSFRLDPPNNEPERLFDRE